MQQDDQRNIIIAVALSFAILLGFNYLMGPSEEEVAAQKAERARRQQDAEAQSGDDTSQKPVLGANSNPAAQVQTSPQLKDRVEALAQTPRIAIETPKLDGSLSLRGGRIDDLVLTDYKISLDEDSKAVTLLSPAGGRDSAYYADFGWITGDPGVAVPNSKTLWAAEGDRLTPESPVTLFWDNGAGLRFERVIAVDQDYCFTINQRVISQAADSALNPTLAPYGLISRRDTPETLGFYILHEGPIGVLNDSLIEIDYDDLADEKQQSFSTSGGWLGITDQYWLAALIPDQGQAVQARFLFTGKGTRDRYQTDYFYEPQSLANGSSLEFVSRVFLGAKEVSLIDRYESELGITDLDLAVDFGWFYYITKPIFYALHWLASVFGNVGLSIMVLTVAIKLLFFPLANTSYRSMARMRKLQPKVAVLRERYSDDRQRMNQEVMNLYRQEKVNPLAGCLPTLIQLPIFFSLYKVLFVTLEMRHAPFFGWVQDLSAPDPTSILNLFGLIPWDIPDLGFLAFLNIGVWPLLMGVSMHLQQRLNPQQADPMQARIFLLMPFFFTFLLASFPSGLVIYWTWSNLLSIIQQAVIMRRAGVPLGSPGGDKAS